MFLGKVVGTVWSTKKIPNLEGLRFLLIHPLDSDKAPKLDLVVAADTLGAGVGETVIVAYGRAARLAVANENVSIEAAVVGIVDRMDYALDLPEEFRRKATKLVTRTKRGKSGA